MHVSDSASIGGEIVKGNPELKNLSCLQLKTIFIDHRQRILSKKTAFGSAVKSVQKTLCQRVSSPVSFPLPTS